MTIGIYFVKGCRVWYDQEDWVGCNSLMIFISNEQAREWATNN